MSSAPGTDGVESRHALPRASSSPQPAPQQQSATNKLFGFFRSGSRSNTGNSATAGTSPSAAAAGGPGASGSQSSGQQKQPGTTSLQVQTVSVVDPQTAAEIDRFRIAKERDQHGPLSYASDVAAFVVGCALGEASAPVKYDIVVCVQLETGAVELRSVQRRFKQFYDLYKRMRGTADIDLVKNSVHGFVMGNADGGSGGGEAGGASEETTIFLAKRKRELQRFLDELLSEPRALYVPDVTNFLGLNLAPDWTVPSFDKDAIKKPVCCCPRAADKESMVDACSTLRAQLGVFTEERKLEQDRTERLEESQKYLQAMMRNHDDEIKRIQTEADARVNVMAQEIARLQQHTTALMAHCHTTDVENESLREQLTLARRKLAWQQQYTTVVSNELDARRSKCAELEMRCATLASQLRRAVEEVSMLRSLREGNAGAPPPMTIDEVLSYGNNDFTVEKLEAMRQVNRASGGAESDGFSGAGSDAHRPVMQVSSPMLDTDHSTNSDVMGDERPLGETPEENSVSVKVWRQALGQMQMLQMRNELLEQRYNSALSENVAVGKFRDLFVDCQKEYEDLHKTVQQMGVALKEAELAQGAKEEERQRELERVEREVEDERTAKKELLVQLDALRSSDGVRQKHIEELERRQALAYDNTYNSFMPTLEIVRGVLHDATDSIKRRDQKMVLQRYMIKQLVIEIALLRKQLERMGMAHSLDEVDPMQLVYMRSLSEALRDWNSVEAQNESLRRQVQQLTEDAVAAQSRADFEKHELQSRCESVTQELMREKERGVRLGLVLQQHKLDTTSEERTVSEDDVVRMTDLQHRNQELEYQLEDVKKTFFFCIALEQKLKTNSSCDLMELYVEELPHAGIALSGWPEWIKRRVAEYAEKSDSGK